MSNFMVVKERSSNNAILGRPTLVAMKTETSIDHLCLKFSTPHGIGVVQGNQYEARKCYTTSVRSAPADSSGKRTVWEAGLVDDETLTIEIPEARCEVDPRLPAQ